MKRATARRVARVVVVAGLVARSAARAPVVAMVVAAVMVGRPVVVAVRPALVVLPAEVAMRRAAPAGVGLVAAAPAARRPYPRVGGATTAAGGAVTIAFVIAIAAAR